MEKSPRRQLSRDEILTQLNAADGPRRILALLGRAMLLPFRLGANMSVRIRRPPAAPSLPVVVSSWPPPRLSHLPPLRVAARTVTQRTQRKCLGIVQYRAKCSKSSISLSNRRGLRDRGTDGAGAKGRKPKAEGSTGTAIRGSRARDGHEATIKRRRPAATLDTHRTYYEDSRNCSGFHSSQFCATDEDGTPGQPRHSA